MQILKSLVLKLFYFVFKGYVIYNPEKHMPVDFDSHVVGIFSRVKKFTLTSPERVCSLVEAVRYVVRNNISGDFVECGVWRGGSVMTMACTLESLNVANRTIHLYDTFSGMTAPSNEDVEFTNKSAKDVLGSDSAGKDGSPGWCVAGLEDVKRNLSQVNYPFARYNFVVGDILQTIPKNLPPSIALLRLDTDWYESTKHELIHLFPKLEKGGVLIIDDYGHWKGARKAVDEFLLENNVRMFLSRVDYSARIGIKA